ncbi:MAG TPA: selenocysteine-specific translation elongation factor [Gammaproteobacteria bacterium]
MIVGTAGHIDHGKSALVRALTGVDPDRLKEEKERGITLDLGYAYHEIDEQVIGFVDVPGHERLIHNMLAGASGIDYVLLVIAADDGPMPQTREHLQILELLGLTRGAVVLSKIDRVELARLATATTEIRHLLASSAFADAPLFPLSSVTGEGIAALRHHLGAVARMLPSRTTAGPFRLAVDRSFTLTGAGTVVTGTVYSGSVQLEDRLLLTPSGKEVRVRALHAQNQPTQKGHAGQRCALNLAGLDKSEVARGDWVVSPALHAPTRRLDVRLRLLPDEERTLKHWTPVHLHLATSHLSARIALLEGEHLEPGHECFAQLVLESAIGAQLGDRFVIRDQSAQRTLGGGVIIDPAPPAKGRRAPERLTLLSAIHRGDAAQVLACTLKSNSSGVDLRRFATEWSLDDYETATLLPMAVVSIASAPWGFAQEQWDALGTASLAALADEHQSAPHRQGLDRERLRRRVAPGMSRPAFGARIDALLAARRICKTGPALHLPDHQVRLPPAEESLWNKQVAPLLRAEPYNPPRVRDVARTLGQEEEAIRALLNRLAEMGELFRVAHDHYFTREAVANLSTIARELAEVEGKARAAAFRDRIGGGRKVAIQILEFFDRVGYSRRLGDGHHVHRDSLLEFN